MTARKYPTGNCKHCKRAAYLRPRGLCSGCYENREIRALHPAKITPLNNRGVGLEPAEGVVPYSLPDRPTLAAPGTHEKLKVFQARLRNRQSLFHPRDVRHLNWSAPADLLPIQGLLQGGGGRERSRPKSDAEGRPTCSRCDKPHPDPKPRFRCCQKCRQEGSKNYYRRKNAARKSR